MRAQGGPIMHDDSSKALDSCMHLPISKRIINHRTTLLKTW